MVKQKNVDGGAQTMGTQYSRSCARDYGCMLTAVVVANWYTCVKLKLLDHICLYSQHLTSVL